MSRVGYLSVVATSTFCLLHSSYGGWRHAFVRWALSPILGNTHSSDVSRDDLANRLSSHSPRPQQPAGCHNRGRTTARSSGMGGGFVDVQAQQQQHARAPHRLSATAPAGPEAAGSSSTGGSGGQQRPGANCCAAPTIRCVRVRACARMRAAGRSGDGFSLISRLWDRSADRSVNPLSRHASTQTTPQQPPPPPTQGGRDTVL